MRNRRIFVAWLLTGVLVLGLLASGVGAFWMIAGLLMLGWGLVVSTNYRGAAAAMPTRAGIGPFWQETSRGMIRLIFGFFALFGLGLLIAGVARSI
jgi:hypothetical protein